MQNFGVHHVTSKEEGEARLAHQLYVILVLYSVKFVGKIFPRISKIFSAKIEGCSQFFFLKFDKILFAKFYFSKQFCEKILATKISRYTVSIQRSYTIQLKSLGQDCQC